MDTKPDWYTEQHDNFIVIRCDFDIGGFPAGCCEAVSRAEMVQAINPEMILKVRIYAMDQRRKCMIEASYVKP